MEKPELNILIYIFPELTLFDLSTGDFYNIQDKPILYIVFIRNGRVIKPDHED